MIVIWTWVPGWEEAVLTCLHAGRPFRIVSIPAWSCN